MRKGKFVVLGDLQPTSSLEVWRESNHEERKRIVREIADEAPDFLALLGDLVFCGSSTAAWADFDRLCAPLRSQKTLLLPILGNHEYWLSRRAALGNYFARFPHLRGSQWYSVSYGPLGLIFLDSNLRWLPAEKWRAQLSWFEEELERFEGASETRGVLVLLHHPPFTNSTLTSDERHVQRYFLPHFQRATKTLAMVSGHVHSYERFERDGKTFLVAGGGGGPRVTLAVGSRRRHGDELFGGPALRSFHFLVLTLAEEGVEVDVRGLEKRANAFDTMDRFTLSWPSASARSAS